MPGFSPTIPTNPSREEQPISSAKEIQMVGIAQQPASISLISKIYFLGSLGLMQLNRLQESSPAIGPTKAPLPRLAAKRQPTPALPLREADPAMPSASVIAACGRLGHPSTPATTYIITL